MTKEEKFLKAIIEEINCFDSDQLVQLNNTYCDNVNCPDDQIYSNDANFFADNFSDMMEAVRAGLGATIQPGAAMVRVGSDQLVMTEIDEPNLFRRTMIASLSDEEMSLAGLAARQVLAEVARETAVRGQWPGTRLIAPAR